MPIQFNEIPTVYRVPGNYQEVDNSLANTMNPGKNVLIIGQRLASSSAKDLTLYEIPDGDTAISLFGNGSELAMMAAAFKAYNHDQTLFAIAVPKGATATAAVSSLTFTTATASSSGTLKVVVAGTAVYVDVAKGQSSTDIAKQITAAINAAINLPVTAISSADGVITLTAVNSGEGGNELSLSSNEGDFGLSAKFALATPGIGNPKLADIWPVLGETPYSWFVQPYLNEENLNSLDGELASRYTAMRQIGGRAFIAKKGDYTTVKAFGLSRNSPHVTCLDCGDSPTPAYVAATINCAVVVSSLAIDPAAPVAGSKLAIVPPSQQRSSSQQNDLLFSGISPINIAGNSAFLVRQITLYKQNDRGQADNSYLDIQIPETLDAMRNYRKAEAAKLFSGYKLAQTEETFAPTQKVMTAKQWRSFLIALYQNIFVKQFAWCQNSDDYEKTLVVQLDATDKSRLNYQDQPTLIGQFLVSAGKVSFK